MKYDKPVNLRLTKEENRRLRLYAKSQGMDLSETIRGLIRRCIKIRRPAKNLNSKFLGIMNVPMDGIYRCLL